ncbi:MAG: 30S ribosomal protein S12 methylthiotransferase RimO [Defluviitaleaceae bacterium]|nr:30S ribosomal protein S12 methylthiotransferase RimO [Defluviitaleaceae bacterium]
MIEIKNPKIAFISLGCDKNLVDSEVMLGLINKEGYEISSEENSDIIIINTCGFIMDATNEGIQTILRLAEYKKIGSCKALIVTGCMAQRYEQEIFKELPEVDAVIGTTQFQKLPKVLKEVMAGKQVSYLASINTPLPEDLFLLRKPTNKHFAYLKISEGCDKNCTYCTIPSIRGSYRSRTIESLLKEATLLANAGVKELILVAQDSALYGTDLYNENMLHILLQELSKIDGIKWLRILYAYPEHITEETIAEISNNPKVLPYLDMPIQHSHDYILKRMGRRMSGSRLREIIANLRAKIPNITIRTTLIVGFPGEEEIHFLNLVEFIKDIKFDRLGVFAYSKEENTPAAKLNNQVEDYVKQFRKSFIMKTQEKISKEKLQSKVGETMEAVVEKKWGEKSYIARTYMDCYEIDGYVNFDSNIPLNIGDFVNVKITHSLDHDLSGEII